MVKPTACGWGVYRVVFAVVDGVLREELVAVLATEPDAERLARELIANNAQ